jgi:Lrp/AsnC family transcriptional regulator, regulator for asnA, asnC and gidA
MVTHGLRRATTIGATMSEPSPERLAGAVFDATDRAIVECLREDGRMSHADIARRLGAAEATVRRRLNRMQASGMLRVVPVIDPDSVGLQTSLFLGVRIEGGGWQEVARAIAALPEVRYVAVTTGNFDLLVEAFVAHREHLATFVLDQIAQLPGVVSTDTMTVLRVEKFVYEWEVPDVPQRESS